MRVSARVVSGVLAALVAAGAGAPDPDPGRLALIRTRAHQRLSGLPNYTCVEAIERSQRQARDSRFRPLDRVRLEVALINGREHFAWPGARKFLSDEVLDIVRDGAVGTGGFAMFIRNLFLTPGVQFDWAGEESAAGRRLLRYDYRVAREHSGFHLRAGGRIVLVGFQGSVWADAATLDLARLEVHAAEIPAGFGIAAASDTVEYGLVRVGTAEFLLPVAEEMLLTDASGVTSRNRTEFTGCRQYAGSASVSFGEMAEPGGAMAAAPAGEAPALPEGLTFSVLLDAALRPETAYIGDPVTGRVGTDAKRRGVVLIRKGTPASGRIAGLRDLNGDGREWQITLQFESLGRDGGVTAGFPATLVGLRVAGSLPSSTLTELRLPAGPGSRSYILASREPQPPGLALLVVAGASRGLPRGLHLLWRTTGTPSAR